MKNPSHWLPYCCARDCLYNIVYAMLAIVDHIFIIVSLGTYDLYFRMTLSQFCRCDDENLQKLLDASDTPDCEPELGFDIMDESLYSPDSD